MFVCLCFYLYYLYLSIFTYVHISISWSIFVSIYICAYLSVCFYRCMSLYVAIYLPTICLSIWLCFYLYMYLFFYLSACRQRDVGSGGGVQRAHQHQQQLHQSGWRGRLHALLPQDQPLRPQDARHHHHQESVRNVASGSEIGRREQIGKVV